jgi:hypothetical protein
MDPKHGRGLADNSHPTQTHQRAESRQSCEFFRFGRAAISDFDFHAESCKTSYMPF